MIRTRTGACSLEQTVRSSLLATKSLSTTGLRMPRTPAGRLHTKTSASQIHPVPPLNGLVFFRTAPPVACSSNFLRRFSAIGRNHEEIRTAAVDAPRYKFRISASYSPKGHKYQPHKDTWNFDSSVSEFWPSFEKRLSDAGQDAFFVSNVNGTGAVAIGVV